jgi:Carboxypeptidase regulatory-like domain
MYCGGNQLVDMGGLRVGSIEGTVQDQTGAAIPKARVQVQVQSSGKLVRNFYADSHGRFTVAHLPTDDYWLGISGPGFNLHYWSVRVVHHGHKFTLRAELSSGS